VVVVEKGGLVHSKNQEVERMNWIGRLGDNVEASIRLDGNLVSKPVRRCRCGAEVDLSKIIEDELGGKLTQALYKLEKKRDWDKKWEVLSRNVVDGMISLDNFFKEQLKLMRQYKEQEWELPRDISHNCHAFCPRCQTRLGEVTATLRRVDEYEPADFTKPQLANLQPSKEILAYVSKRLNFNSIEELEDWLAYDTAQKAVAILEKTIFEIENLNLEYNESKIAGNLRSQIHLIEDEKRRRRMELVAAVQRIVEERTPVIH
jgi:hypothetical protein